MSPPTDPTGDLHIKVLETEAGAELGRCYACGTCASGCPVHAQRPEFDPRRIIRMVLLEQEDALIESGVIWLCSTCYTCMERCPQQVGCAQIITELRNIAAAEGRLPEGFKMQLEALRTFGRVYEIEDFDNKKREKLGLAALQTRVPLEPLLDDKEGKE